jgi:peptidyl-prolyl cis-trans isomerase D
MSNLLIESFSIAKLSNIEYLPDSVRASHILLKAEDYNNDLASMLVIIDSLKNLVENGARFEDLARIHGSDGTAAKGGDLGWFEFPDMVAPFSDSCFFAEKGDIKTATTQFGVHLIKVTDQSKKNKKVQIGILERKVEPSSKTYQYIYQRASQFAGINNNLEKFETAVDEETDLTKKVANNLGENDKRIAGLESPRAMIRWAYQAEEGDVSQVFEFGDKFVIAAVSEVREKGYTPIDKIESEITIAVKSC